MSEIYGSHIFTSSVPLQCFIGIYVKMKGKWVPKTTKLLASESNLPYYQLLYLEIFEQTALNWPCTKWNTHASTYVTPQEKCGFSIKRGKYILFFILICIQAQKGQRYPRL
jgi:hypothetical protein